MPVRLVGQRAPSEVVYRGSVFSDGTYSGVGSGPTNDWFASRTSVGGYQVNLNTPVVNGVVLVRFGPYTSGGASSGFGLGFLNVEQQLYVGGPTNLAGFTVVSVSTTGAGMDANWSFVVLGAAS